MHNRKSRQLVTCICLIAFSTALLAASDMAGSRDHPQIPRIDGTIIYGYQYADYDEATFIGRGPDSKYQEYKWGGFAARYFKLHLVRSRQRRFSGTMKLRWKSWVRWKLSTVARNNVPVI